EAAAALCQRIGRLDHNPPNPGMKEDEYKLALKGVHSCNLHQGQANLVEAIDGFMDDSDPANIVHVGHRRWCLHPLLTKTGLGRRGGYCALWAHDASRNPAPAYDFLAFPARGPMPVTFFRQNWAWHISLNPARYRAPDRAVKVKVFTADGNGK